MARLFLLLSLSILACPIAARAGDGVLDLTNLANYANQTRPGYISRDNTPGDNPVTDAGATLGRVLFHDKRLSRNDTVSCSTCHQQAFGFSDPSTASTGVSGTTGRHSMRLINARFGTETRFFWDERATSVEDQATQPIKDHKEMGFSATLGDPAFSDLVDKLAAIPEYRVLFAMTFGDAVIDESRIQKVIAQFVRSIQSFDSKYDAGRAVANDNQPFPNFNPAENNGKALFLNPPNLGGAGCAGCHSPPEFDIDPNSLNNGVIAALEGGTDLTNTRSPSLRDLVGPGGQSNGPFMHNGAFTTLAGVINHYNAIPADNPNLDPRLRRPGGQVQNLNLSAQQRADLEAFLRTLTGNSVYQDEKWSDPFDNEGNLSLIILPASATTIDANDDGTATLHCSASPNLDYRLEWSDNLSSWQDGGTYTADSEGSFTILVSHGPGTFYRLAFETPAVP